MTNIRTTDNGHPTQVTGHCDDRFRPLYERFRTSFKEGPITEVGAAIAVYQDGKLLVDLWGGTANTELNTPWQEDTHCCVFSCTKGVMSLLAMCLVDQGYLNYEEKVAKYWPEYGSHGKGDTTVAQLLSHQAGLPYFVGDIPPGGIWDWRTTSDYLAAAAPQWDPGSQHGYHSLTWGHLAGSLFERATGQGLDNLLENILCKPAGASFRLGPSAIGLPHTATLSTSAPDFMDPAKLASYQVADQQSLLNPWVVNSPAWRQSTWPGAGGFTTARDLARLYWRAIDPKEPMVSAATLDQGIQVRCRANDVVLGQESAFAAGFQRPSNSITPGGAGAEAVWGHRGIYGSTGFADPEQKLSFGYAMNRCENPMADHRLEQLLTALYDCL